MKKFSQSGAIMFLGLLITITYYMFLQQDLVSTTQVLDSICLDKPSTSAHLCASCIQRSDLSIANESSIYISDAADQFKVLLIPKEGYLSCQELLQLVSYQLPMQKAQDIRFEQLGPSKQIFQLLKIQIIGEPVSKFQVQFQIQSFAVFKLKKSQTLQTTLITYSSQNSQTLVKYYGQVLAECILVVSLFGIFYFKFQRSQFRVSFIVIILICIMMLGEAMLPNSAFLTNYAVSLAIGFYFISNSISRLLTTICILSILGLQFTDYYVWGLAGILIIYLLISGSKRFEKVGALGGFGLVIFIICSAFKDHNHWLSLPLRKIIEYSILNLTPILIQFISISDISQKYEKVPDASTPSGVSLPGFQQQIELQINKIENS